VLWRTGCKVVSKDQQHLTIRFIGDADDGLFSEVTEILHDVNASRFNLTLKGVGYFPPRGKPNVLWVGIERARNSCCYGILWKNCWKNSAGTGKKEIPSSPYAREAPPGGAPFENHRVFICKQPLQGRSGAHHRVSPVFERAHASGAVHTIEETYPLI